jgi:membrane peptidoglycan carboxypeptidase
MATVDVRTGAVKAIYGGTDYVTGRQRNAATSDRAQAGSTFKPFALITALDQGISLRSRYDGGSPRQFDDYPKPVTNFGGVPYGYLDLVTATAHSVNTVYVALNEEVGPRNTRQTAIELGIPRVPTGWTTVWATCWAPPR